MLGVFERVNYRLSEQTVEEGQDPPANNCNAIIGFPKGKQSIYRLRRCDFVLQNHREGQDPPLQWRMEFGR